MRAAVLMLLTLALAGCAYESTATPTSQSSMQNGAPSQMPQSANSLPRGSTTLAPILPDNGGANTTTRTAP